MTDKEKIRAEIARRLKLAKKNCIESGWDGYDAQVWVLDDVLSFIDSLPEEQGYPTASDNCEKLDEAAEEYVQKGHLLPEAFIVIPTFKDGAKWQKRKMMEGAVDGSVKWAYNNELVSIHYDDPVGATMCYFAKRNGLNVGDKVKIIIVKEDKQ